jgi:hypothetical protein
MFYKINQGLVGINFPSEDSPLYRRHVSRLPNEFPYNHGRNYFAGLRVTKRNKATVLLTLTLLQTPTLTLTLILTLTLTLLQIRF